MKDIHKSDYGAENYDVRRVDSVLDINITYPGWQDGENPERVRFVQVNQESVRASDGIRLCYDYQRDGWSIMQPKIHEKLVRENVYEDEEEWIETAFVGSWAFERPRAD